MAGIFRKRESEKKEEERRGVFSNFWESDRCVFVNLYETASVGTF